jgi:hypothetical protein
MVLAESDTPLIPRLEPWMLVEDMRDDLDTVEFYVSRPRPIQTLSPREMDEILAALRTEWLSPVNSIRYSFCRILCAFMELTRDSIAFTGIHSPPVLRDALTMIGFVFRIKAHDFRGKLGGELYRSDLCKRAVVMGGLILSQFDTIGGGIWPTLFYGTNL